jgi:hypothetical protein
MLHSDVDPLLFPEDLGLSDNKIIDVPTGISNIVRDASGAVGDVPCLFENDDLQIGLVPLRTACGTHAGRIPTNNDEFHFLSSTIVMNSIYGRSFPSQNEIGFWCHATWPIATDKEMLNSASMGNKGKRAHVSNILQ